MFELKKFMIPFIGIGLFTKQYMKKFLFLLLLIAIPRLTLFCQTDRDSVRCFTVKQQNEIIAKLVHEKELITENGRLFRIIQKKDSTINSLNGTVSDLNIQLDLTQIINKQEKENREKAEKDVKKYKRRTKLFVCATGVFGSATLFLFLGR